MKIPLDTIIQEDDEYILSHHLSFDIFKGDDRYIPSHWSTRIIKKIIGNYYGEYQQWYIICRSKHPFLQSVIKNVIKNIESYDIHRDGVGKSVVLEKTGPVVYTKSILPLLSQYNHTLYRRGEYIGLKYTIFGLFHNHSNKIGIKHYSKLKTPLIIK